MGSSPTPRAEIGATDGDLARTPWGARAALDRSLRTGPTRTTAMGPTPLTPLLVGQRLYVLVGKRLLGVDL